MRFDQESKIIFILCALQLLRTTYGDAESLKNLGLVLTNSSKSTYFVAADQTTTLNIEFTPHVNSFDQRDYVCYNDKSDLDLQAQTLFNILLSDWIGLKSNHSLIIPGELNEKHRKINLPLMTKEIKIENVYGTYNLGHTKHETSNLIKLIDNNPRTFITFNEHCALETAWNTFNFNIIAAAPVEHILLQFSKESAGFVNFSSIFPKIDKNLPNKNWKPIHILDSHREYAIIDLAKAFNETMAKKLESNSSFKYPTEETKPLTEFVINLKFDNITTERWTIGGQSRNMASECVNFKMFEIAAYNNRTLEEAERELRAQLNGDWDSESSDLPVLTRSSQETRPLSRRRAIRPNFAYPDSREQRTSPSTPVLPKIQSRRKPPVHEMLKSQIEVETTLIPLTTSIGENLLETTTAISSEYEEYSYEVPEICRGDSCRHRRQAIALAIAGLVLGGVTAGSAVVVHNVKASKEIRIRHDELLSSKLAKATEKDLEDLHIQISQRDQDIMKAFRDDCKTLDVISNREFVNTIINEFEDFKLRITNEILNLKTRASFEHNKALETVINSCIILNGPSFEPACRDFIELTTVRVSEYTPKLVIE